MRNFVKMKTRLNCDLFEAYRSLTRKNKMEKWGAIFQDNGFEVKMDKYILCAELSQVGNLNESVEPVIWRGLIKLMNLNSDNPSEVIQPCQLVFYRMNCMQKTEYCVELHLVLEPIGDVTLPDSNFKEVGDYVLEQIRKQYNKDWIILDSDLSAGILRGSF